MMPEGFLHHILDVARRNPLPNVESCIQASVFRLGRLGFAGIEAGRICLETTFETPLRPEEMELMMEDRGPWMKAEPISVSSGIRSRSRDADA